VLRVNLTLTHAKQASPVWWGYSHLIAGAWHTTVQGRNQIRQHPGQEASLVSPCLNLRSLGSNCVLKKVLVTLFGLFGAPAVILRSA